MQTPRCCSSMMSRSPLIVPTGSSSSSYQLFIVGGSLAGSIEFITGRGLRFRGKGALLTFDVARSNRAL